MVRSLTFSITLLLSLSCAQAEYFELGAPVAGHPGKTWFDLVKAIVPDLQPDGSSSTAVQLPYVEDLGEQDEDPVPELPFHVGKVEVEKLEADGRALTVLSIGLGPAEGWAANIEALALFDEDLQLLDAINVGQDKSTELRGAPFRISATDEALLTYSEHFNSNQTYGSYALIMVRDGKFQLIDTVGTLSDRWCGHERTQGLAVSTPEAGEGFWPIIVTVADIQKTVEEDGDCGDEVVQPGFETAYPVTYRWSASMGLYVADGNGFAGLAAINEGRY